jgi:hypothetical protein
MRLNNRLGRLEQKLPNPGCPDCSDRRGRMVLALAHRLPDGSVVLRDKEPEACGLCGVVPEDVVKVIRTIVGVPRQPENALGGNKERP